MKVCYRLADLAEIGRGSSPRPITDQRYFENGDIPWIKIADATASGKYIYETKEHVNEYGASFSRKLKPESLIIAASGTLGFPKFLGVEGCIHDGWMYFSDIDESLITKDYLYYYLITLTDYFNNLSYGAAIQNINTPIVKKTKVFLPPLDVQAKISNALSTYDELIENNNKRIKLLEQMAENLYKEWFGHFRFPNHETTEFENGLPKGWEYVKFEDILSFNRGISYSSEEIDCDDGLNLINLKNIDSFGGFRRDGTKKYNGKYKETQVVKKGDLVIGVTDMTQDRRTVGAAALIPTIKGTSVISADLVKVVSDIPNIYLYCLCRYGFYSKYFSQFANGANVLHLKPRALLNKKVLLPTKDLTDDFVEKVSALIELIDELNLANDNLVKQRDLLLPRLMSGKLEV